MNEPESGLDDNWLSKRVSELEQQLECERAMHEVEIERMRDAHGPLVEDLNQALDQVMGLKEQLRRAWRPWPPEGPERDVECADIPRSDDRRSFCRSTARFFDPGTIIYRELEEFK